MNNVDYVQRQVKAFNKALSRAEKAGYISGEAFRSIYDLIDNDRMTISGYGKAGKKFLSEMTPEELLLYSADIQQANELLSVEKMLQELDIESAKDPKGLLWSMYNKLEDAGFAFDSTQVHAVELGDVNISYRSMIQQMNKYLNDPDYGLSDVDKWFKEQSSLEV